MAHSKSHFLFLAKRWKDLQDVHRHQELMIKWCSVFPLHVQFMFFMHHIIFYSVYFCRPKLVDFDIPTTVPAKQSSPFGDDFGSYTPNDISTIKPPNTGRKPQIRYYLPPNLPLAQHPKTPTPKPQTQSQINNLKLWEGIRMG